MLRAVRGRLPTGRRRRAGCDCLLPHRCSHLHPRPRFHLHRRQSTHTITPLSPSPPPPPSPPTPALRCVPSSAVYWRERSGSRASCGSKSVAPTGASRGAAHLHTSTTSPFILHSPAHSPSPAPPPPPAPSPRRRRRRRLSPSPSPSPPPSPSTPPHHSHRSLNTATSSPSLSPNSPL